MKSTLITQVFLLLSGFVFAGEFLCGGVGGIPCTTECQGQWSDASQAYVSCECPQGRPCVCYCPAGGGSAQAGTGQPAARPTSPAGTFEDFLDNAPACPDVGPGPCQDCGVFRSISGRIGIERNGEWCLAYTDLALQPGDFVYATDGSSGRILLSDGGTMDLDSNSQFIFEGLEIQEKPGIGKFTGQLIMSAARGVYHFMMSKDRIEQFEVRTNSAVIGIKGTEFVVEATDTYTKLKVLDGSVDFWKSGSDARVLVNGGESSVLGTGDPAPSYPQEFNVAGESRWWNDGGCCGSAFILALLLAGAFVHGRPG